MNLHDIRPPRTMAEWCAITWPEYTWEAINATTVRYRERNSQWPRTTWTTWTIDAWTRPTQAAIRAWLAGHPYTRQIR